MAKRWPPILGITGFDGGTKPAISLATRRGTLKAEEDFAQPAPPSGTGACCYDDGTCDDLTEADCIESGGTPQGAGTNCDPNLCEPPLDCTPPESASVTGAILSASGSEGDCPGTSPPQSCCDVSTVDYTGTPTQTGTYPDYSLNFSAHYHQHVLGGTQCGFPSGHTFDYNFDSRIDIHFECISDGDAPGWYVSAFFFWDGGSYCAQPCASGSIRFKTSGDATGTFSVSIPLDIINDCYGAGSVADWIGTVTLQLDFTIS